MALIDPLEYEKKQILIEWACIIEITHRLAQKNPDFQPYLESFIETYNHLSCPQK